MADQCHVTYEFDHRHTLGLSTVHLEADRSHDTILAHLRQDATRSVVILRAHHDQSDHIYMYVSYSIPTD